MVRFHTQNPVSNKKTIFESLFKFCCFQHLLDETLRRSNTFQNATILLALRKLLNKISLLKNTVIALALRRLLRRLLREVTVFENHSIPLTKRKILRAEYHNSNSARLVMFLRISFNKNGTLPLNF